MGTSEFYRVLGVLYYERGDLDSAVQHLRTSKKLAMKAALPNWQPRLNIAEARVKEVQGNLEGALELLNEAERLYFRSPLPEVRPAAALKAQILIRQGKLIEAQGWIQDMGLSPDDALSFSREFEHITLARLLIARYLTDRIDSQLHEAIRLLERLLQAAESGGRMGSVIEIFMLLALAHRAQGDLPQALGSLERALSLARPEGYFAIFVNEGPPMAELLVKMKGKGRAPCIDQYTEKLLVALGIRQREFQPSPTEMKSTKTRLNTEPSPLAEPLSERELEVLKLLRTEMSGPEIARELSVSLNTLRTHTKNIFSKLGVNNRRAAVRRAEELGLF